MAAINSSCEPAPAVQLLACSRQIDFAPNHPTPSSSSPSLPSSTSSLSTPWLVPNLARNPYHARVPSLLVTSTPRCLLFLFIGREQSMTTCHPAVCYLLSCEFGAKLCRQKLQLHEMQQAGLYSNIVWNYA